MDEIHKANGEVLGISVDSPFSQAKWAEQEGFRTTLLSDLGKETVKMYSTMYEDLMGMKGIAKRSAFLVDKSGTIVQKEILDDAKNLPDLDGLIGKMISMA